MKAKILIPSREQLSPEAYREIKFGNKEKAAFCLHREAGYRWEDTIELPTLADGPDAPPMTPEIFNKVQYDFLEDCFDHTAMSDSWQSRRPICVGDVLVIQGGSTWFCANVSWEKI